MRVAAVVAALIAVICIVLAIAGMVTGRPGDRAGVFLRIAALVSFGLAVGLNLAAH